MNESAEFMQVGDGTEELPKEGDHTPTSSSSQVRPAIDTLHQYMLMAHGLRSSVPWGQGGAQVSGGVRAAAHIKKHKKAYRKNRRRARRQ